MNSSTPEFRHPGKFLAGIQRCLLWAVLGTVWLACRAWAAEKDAWGVELDAGGVGALASPTVRNEGKTGLSAGGLVRYGGNKGWSKGLGYNVLSLQNGHRLRPATFVGDRRWAPWGSWSPYVRAGAGIGTDKEAGSMNRLVVRGGAGVSRAVHPHWEVGLKSELWYSPSSGQTGEDMFLVTAGLTLARSFQTIPRQEPPAKAVEQKKPEKATTPPPPPAPGATFPQEGKENKCYPSPLGRGQGEGPGQLPQKVLDAPRKINILFQFDRSDAAGSDLAAKTKELEGAAKWMLEDAEARAEIHGHADSRGPLGYNIALSRKRAATVRDFMVTHWGIAANRFTIYAHGAKDPAASNATPHGRAKNRRVLVLVIP